MLATHFPDQCPADLADRLIAATARAEGVPLVSRDARIRAGAVVETIWCRRGPGACPAGLAALE